MKNMDGLTKIVKQKTAVHLPENFALVFETLTKLSDTIFPDANGVGYTKLLLAFPPFIIETQLTIKAQCDFIVCIVETVYDKSMNHVTAIIGDNCETKRVLANLLNTPFIGCHSHRFNLAVKVATTEHEQLLSKVNTLMCERKNFKLTAELRLFT